MFYRVLGAPGRTRTCALQIRRLLLYPLSYWGPEVLPTRNRGHGVPCVRDLLTADSTHLDRILLCTVRGPGNTLGR